NAQSLNPALSSLRDRTLSPRRARSRIARIPVIKPHTCVIKPEAIEGDIWRQVKGCEIGEYGKYSNITTHYHTLGVQWRGLTEV
ncbi:MAG: hypothetical protein OXQ84_17510, partial [bacterium]|nr:hypothetical protein [bacterium]